jgi:hypothetical protein
MMPDSSSTLQRAVITDSLPRAFDSFANRCNRPSPRGVATKNSTVPSSGVSDELRKYPQDMLSSPLDVREARFTLVPGGPVADGTSGGAAGSLSTGNYSFGSNGYVGGL